MNPTLELDFDDLEPISIPIKIRGKRYILKEASANDARKWRNAIFAQTRMHDGKISGLGNVADSEALLVSLCLYEVKPYAPETGYKPEEIPVPLKTVLEWPNKLVKPLFTHARRISDLEEKETPDTEESLTAEITRLTTKLDELRNGSGDSSTTPTEG